MVQKGLKVHTVSRNGDWSIRSVYPFGNSNWGKDGYVNYANTTQACDFAEKSKKGYPYLRMKLTQRKLEVIEY